MFVRRSIQLPRVPRPQYEVGCEQDVCRECVFNDCEWGDIIRVWRSIVLECGEGKSVTRVTIYMGCRKSSKANQKLRDQHRNRLITLY